MKEKASSPLGRPRMKLKNLKKADREIYDLIKKEAERQEADLELIASENYTSPAVLEAASSLLTNKYAEGTPGHRHYVGCKEIDKVEELAIERACKLFKADHANVQPHSGANANLAAFLAVLEPGDKVLALDPDQGGHLSHGDKTNISGHFYNFSHYGVNEEGLLDYEEIRKKALDFKPKLIVCGGSAYPREIDFNKFREIADEVGAYLMADIAHIAGIIAGGYHQNPFPVCDIVTTTTHKTLRGPRSGLIMCKEDLKDAVDFAVFPELQAGPLEHIVAAKAVAFGEALKPSFKRYIGQVIKNSKALSKAMEREGFEIVTGGTDNHLLIVDLRSFGLTGKACEERLATYGISTNSCLLKDDPDKENTSGLRLGTSEVTTRGMKEEEMEEIGELIAKALKSSSYDKGIEKKVRKLTSSFPVYGEDLWENK